MKLRIFERSDKLAADQYCFGFKRDGGFVEQKNAGWCGTPPIAYGQYEGSWSIQDSIVSVTVPFWGGMSHYSWKVTEVGNDRLVFIVQ